VLRLLAVLAWLAGVAFATPVFAHAVLVETQPSDRAVLGEAPTQIVLRFNEPVRPVAIQVLDQDGRGVAGDVVHTLNNDLQIAVPPKLANGSYLVSYRVISADAHPVSGSFLFAIGAAPETWAETPVIEKPAVHWPALAAMNRAISLAAIMIATGAAIFLLLFRRADRSAWVSLRPIVHASAFIAGMTVSLTVGLQGALIAGAGPDALINKDVWRLGAESTRGTAAVAAIFGLALIAAAMGRMNRVGAFCGIAAVIASFALSGHAATAMPRFASVPALLIHTAGAAFWLGAFVPLLQVLHQRKNEVATLQRFSAQAMVGVPILLVAGTILAVFQVQHLEALVTTNYGVTLLLKLAGVVVLLAIAAANRYVLLPRLVAGAPNALSRLRLAIFAELFVGFFILVMTAIMTQAVPPRSISTHDAHDHQTHRVEGQAVALMRSGRMAIIEVTPARAGRNTILLYLSDTTGQPVRALEAEVEFANIAAGIAPLRRKLSMTAPGHFTYAGPELTLAGPWQLRLDVLVNDFEKSIFETEIAVR
jgi:copper transport protein